MAKRQPAMLGLALVVIFLTLERLAMYFFARQELETLLFLDMYIVYALGLSVLLFISGDRGKKIIISLIKEDRTFKSVALSILIGVGGGLVFAVFALGGTLQSITSSLGGTYIPLGDSPTLNTVRLAVVGTNYTPTQHIILTFFMSVFHIAASEEILMAVVTGLILAGLGMTLKIDSVAELTSPGGQLALVIRGVLFALLHLFAYSNGLSHFSIGYFIPAVIGGIWFGVLLYWRGLVAAIFAHGIYDFTYTMVSHTGWGFLLRNIGIFIIIIGIAYIIYIELLKKKLAKLHV